MAELPKRYIEDPNHRIQPVYLSDEVYGQAMLGFVIVCTDVVIIDRKTRSFYLTTRKTKPMQGKWIIGGRMKPGETELQSVTRCFRRETGLSLSEEHFEYIRTNRYLWKDREQEPQDAGTDNLVYVFAVELTPEELDKVALDEKEYSGGLEEFGLARLMNENSHPAIIDLYQVIFPSL